MAEARAIAEHGSRIITALERAWAAIQDQHPDVPDVVIVTGAGSNQKGTPEGYRLRGHHWPERWILDGQNGQRAPELFIAGELLSAGGHAVVEVMLHEAAHALTTRRGIKDTSAAGNRYHNKRFVALAAELGLRGPDVPDKISGWSDCTLTGQAAYDGYADVAAGIDNARLPFLADLASRPGRGGGGGKDQGDGETGTPTKRGGRRLPAECACQPEPRRISSHPSRSKTAPSSAARAAPPSSSPTTAPSPRATHTAPEAAAVLLRIASLTFPYPAAASTVSKIIPRIVIWGSGRPDRARRARSRTGFLGVAKHGPPSAAPEPRSRIRTADLAFTRSPALRNACSTCTDSTAHSSADPRRAGIIRQAVPRPVPRRKQSLATMR